MFHNGMSSCHLCHNGITLWEAYIGTRFLVFCDLDCLISVECVLVKTCLVYSDYCPLKLLYISGTFHNHTTLRTCAKNYIIATPPFMYRGHGLQSDMWLDICQCNKLHLIGFQKKERERERESLLQIFLLSVLAAKTLEKRLSTFL